MASEIRAQIEELDEIVKGFSNELGNYVDSMQRGTDGLNGVIAALAGTWQGSLYENFKRKMYAETSKMNEAMARGINLRRELDDISAQFADALATLKESGDV